MLFVCTLWLEVISKYYSPQSNRIDNIASQQFTSARAIGGIVGCVWVYMQNGKWSYAIGGNMVTRNKNKLVERKASVDTGEIKGADLRDKFLF